MNRFDMYLFFKILIEYSLNHNERLINDLCQSNWKRQTYDTAVTYSEVTKEVMLASIK